MRHLPAWNGEDALRCVRVVLGLPVVALGVALVLWIKGRRWGRLALLVLLALLLTPLAVWIFFESNRAELTDPGQYYSAEGWPWIGFYGAYLAGAVLLLAWLVRSAFGLAVFLRKRKTAGAVPSSAVRRSG